MNDFVYALIFSLIAGLSTVIGSLFIFIKIKRENIDKFITFCLSFSFAVMMCISIFDLLPEGISNLINTLGVHLIVYIIVIWFISYLILKIILYLLRKIDSNLYKVGVLSMIVLIMHNLPEGIMTFLGTFLSKDLGLKLSIAIALHNIPEGIAIAVPIYYSTGSKKKAFYNTLISGLSEPIGGVGAYLLLSKFITPKLINFILLIVAFIMITLSIESLFPEASKYKENKYLILGIIIGSVVSLVSIIL